jgi:transcriptional regulator with XRE-family HTH domain
MKHRVVIRKKPARKERISPKAIVPMDILSLKAVVGSQNSLAGILGVDRSSVTRWVSGEDAPDQENAEKIVGLRYVITRLSKFLEPEAVGDWLEGINAHLRNQRPIDLLRNGRMTEVIAAIEQAEAGSYA